MDFLNLADNEDVGDFTDIATGRDISLTTVGPEVTGTSYNKTTIMPKVKETPLSSDASEVQSWLDNQPNPVDVFKKYSYDEMKEALQKWLTPDEPEEGSIIDDEDEPETEPVALTKNYALKTPIAPKVSKAEKFDSLFDEEESDLPF